MLPTTINPFEDEILDSWVYRLVKANGFDDIRTFYNIYFYKNYGTRVNTYRDLSDLLDEAGINNYSEFILNHTLYPVTSLFMDCFRQSAFLDMICCLQRRSASTVNIDLRICPKCMATGNYVRVYHCFPGVHVCPIHGEILLDGLDDKQVVEKFNEEDLDFAKYCYELYLLKPDFDDSLFNNAVSFENGIKTLMDICPDFNFSSYHKTEIIDVPAYKTIYTSNNLCEFEHLNCHKHFCMNFKAFNQGFKCPDCREPEKEFYDKLVARTGKYKMIKYSKQYLTLKHEHCGEITNIRTANWVNGTRCRCETENTLPALKKEFAQNYPEFDVIEYKNEVVTIVHKSCKAKRSLTLAKWRKRPICRKCNPVIVLNKENVEKTINSYGFKLIDVDSKNKVRRIKIECPKQHQRSILYFSFIENPVCPECKSLINNKEKKFIDEHLETNYTDNDIVFSEDLTKVLGNKFHYDLILDLGYKRLAAGIYCKYDATDAEIITARYINRNGIIGYTYGETFAYELGLIEKPAIISICTDKEASYKGRFVDINNTKLRLRKLISGFDSRYWKEWQLADFMKSLYKYMGNNNFRKVMDAIFKHIERNNLNITYLNSIIDYNHKYAKALKEYLNEKEKQEN